MHLAYSKLLISLFLFITLSLTLTAQDKITFQGKIVESNHLQPLPGAQITIKSENITSGTTTDNQGRFNITLDPGAYEFIISYLGYEPRILMVNPEKTNLGTIELIVSSTSLNEIIVSASAKNYRRDFKGSNFTVNPASILKMNPINTEEVLRTVPGVNIVGDMGLSNRPNISIRGSWGRRSKKVLLMEDGSPSAPAPYIAPGAYYNPVSDRVKAIEVYKGADMLRYGPNNMYGAVNYITALPPEKPELRLKLIGGQRNYMTGLLSYGGTWNNLGALVEAVYKNFDGFTDNSSVKVLNLNAKIFAKLSNNQSLYFKVSGQFEDNQASLSSQTPFTFEADPTENPFDADIFTMRRYGLDIIHKWLINPSLSLTSKIYASDFERDWWRQNTTKIRASEVESYVGAAIFNDRYGYMRNLEFNEDDYVRVGQVNNGRESTSDSRWFFTVAGVEEKLITDWEAWGEKHELEVGLKFHNESYKDRSVRADSSRWARSGNTVSDIKYGLWSVSTYLRNEFNFNKFSVTPIMRFEYVDMYRQNLLDISQDPDITGLKDGREPNTYSIFLPGITIDYQLKDSEVYTSVYKGFIAPSKVFGFLVEQNGIVTNPFANQSINIDPEISLNTEIGWRGSMLNDKIDGQVTYFNNTIKNFYAGGRNEVFQELGKINMQGLEIGLNIDLLRLEFHHIGLYGNATLLRSEIKSGRLVDKDLFSEVIHNDATREEFINKVNNNRDAYEIYTLNNTGEEELYTEETLTSTDFDNISQSIVRFGNNGVTKADAPYTPKVNFNIGMNYDFKELSVGISGQYVGEQYTEFNNFSNESADGSIGKLPSFFTMDAFAGYDFSLKNKVNLNVFINAKNITNEIYRASRLNRATSGIFPGGFRQIIFGMNIRI